MLLSIRHQTIYRYAAPATFSVQSLRLTPPNFYGQHIHNWSVVTKGAESVTEFRDAMGNKAHLAVYPNPLDAIEIEAFGIVETEDRNGIYRSASEFVPTRVFLRETPLTKADASIRELLSDLSGESRLADLHALMDIIRGRVTYEPGLTNSDTTAADALSAGHGVCQDHAHIFIAAARYAGIPSRYVTGYLWCGEGDDSEAHHAWAEAYVDDLGWVGFDVANLVCPTADYVRLSMGLDAPSAAPVRGARHGGDQESLDVFVAVQQANAQQQ
ncbi:MAG: transglutaminase family protein [Alphaproteobacteria bacterium]|nr:transglutaminase family protein [Alphaproteobacteria bacterium]